jgi:1-acyl-sn-glycerol-3-phosphate acyltransferase
VLFYFFKALLTLLFIFFNRWRVEGRENVPARGGVILASNHTSYADPPLVGTACPRRVFFMAKQELFRMPLLGWLIPRVHSFPVRRGKGDRRALREAVRLLNRGEVVLIFPEGTRSPNGRLQPPELGAAMVALMSGAPVVPMALIGSDRLLPQHSPLPRPAKVTVRFGRARSFLRGGDGRISRKLLEMTGARIMEEIRRLLPERMR